MAKPNGKTTTRRKPGPQPMLNAPEREPITMPGVYEYVEDDGEAPDELLAEVLTRLEGNTDSFCVVSKILMQNGQRREQWLFETPPSTTIEQEIQAAYGEGDYRIRVYQRRAASDGVRRPLLVKNVVLAIGPSREPKPAHGAITAPAPTDRVAELMVEMRAANERANERTMQFMTEMVKALAVGNANKVSSMAEFKDFAAGLGALPKPEKQKDPLEMLGVLWAIIEKMRGNAAPIPVGDDGEVAPGALFIEGMKTVRELMTTARGAQPIPNASDANSATAALPIPVAPLPVASAQPLAAASVQSQESDDMKMVQLYIRSLIKNARAGADVNDYAGQVYSLLTDDALAMMRGETWFEALAAIEPVPVELKPWFARLREAVLIYVAEESNGPDTVATKPNGDLPASAPGSAAPAAKSKRVGAS